MSNKYMCSHRKRSRNSKTKTNMLSSYIDNVFCSPFKFTYIVLCYCTDISCSVYVYPLYKSGAKKCLKCY